MSVPFSLFPGSHNQRYLRSPAHDPNRWVELGISHWINNGNGDQAFLQVAVPTDAQPAPR